MGKTFPGSSGFSQEQSPPLLSHELSRRRHAWPQRLCVSQSSGKTQGAGQAQGMPRLLARRWCWQAATEGAALLPAGSLSAGKRNAPLLGEWDSFPHKAFWNTQLSQKVCV